MLDKITMISFAWMVMVGALLTATVTLYDHQADASSSAKARVTEVTSRAYHLSQY